MISLDAETSQLKKKTFQLGDLGRYFTITVYYVVDTYSYDYIDHYDTNGTAYFPIYPTHRRYKKHEDSNGCAYIAYVNTSLYADGSGVLYDMGVKVGNNTAQGVVKLSSGVDAFLQYMLNPFIWG